VNGEVRVLVELATDSGLTEAEFQEAFKRVIEKHGPLFKAKRTA
jgi:hypothetical protein